MVVAWGIVFVALLSALPSSCLKFPVRAQTEVLDVSSNGRYAVLADRGNLADSYESPEIINLATGAVRPMAKDRFGTPLPIIRGAWICGRHIWLDEVKFPEKSVALFLFDVVSGEPQDTDWLGVRDGLGSVEFSQDGSRAATLNPDVPDEILIWDIETQKRLTSIQGAGNERCLSNDGTLLAIYSTEPQVNSRWEEARWRIYDTGTGTLRAESLGTVDQGANPVSWLKFADETATLLAHGSHENPEGYWTIWNWKAGLSTRFAGSSPQIERLHSLTERLGSDIGIHAKTWDDAWAVTTSSDRTLWGTIIGWIERWFPGTVAGGTREAGVTRLWNVRTGQVALTLTARSIPIHLSESGNALLRIRNGHLEVWTNPSPRPWGLALLGSLVVPVAWVWRKYRRPAMVPL
jgi:hypothetical protein